MAAKFLPLIFRLPKKYGYATCLTGRYAGRQRIAGGNIVGSGSNAQITIRGPVSFTSGGNKPLYVINGSKFGHDYSSVFNSVNPEAIKRVRVLKGADETAIWGTEGAAGVIEITLRDN
jgi:outer membrane receptor protein involved in Fe transport